MTKTRSRFCEQISTSRFFQRSEILIMNEVMTHTEAASFLRCDEEALKQRVLSGEIAYVDDGDQSLFLREDLMDYLRSRRRRHESPADDKKSKKPIAEPIVAGQISFDPAQVSAMTTIPYGTVLAEIRSGSLVARKTGTSYYVHRDTLDEYLKCPAPKSQPASTPVRTPANGSSGTVASRAELAALATLTSGLRKKSSRHT